MKLLSRRAESAALPGVTGTARLDRRTGSLVHRLGPGDVAVIDHVDLDRASAEALVGCGVAAVVNAAPTISGRYPNRGPGVLAAAGILLVDAVGAEVFAALRDGQRIRVHDGLVLRGEVCVASGTVLDAPRVAERIQAARAGLAAQTAAFTASAMDSLEHDRDLLLDGVGGPVLATSFAGRHALVVSPCSSSAAELATLRAYVREHRPVLVGVDSGADVLRSSGYRPDLVVGDPDRIGDAALRGAGEVVAHAGSDRDVGMRRLESLGLEGVPFAFDGTSADAAMLLADAGGATLVVAVGAETTLVDYLDTERSGSAGTFLTRLRLGAKLVDAAAVRSLYASRPRLLPVLVLLLVGLLAVALAVAVTPVGQDWLDSLASTLSSAYDEIAAAGSGDSGAT